MADGIVTTQRQNITYSIQFRSETSSPSVVGNASNVAVLDDNLGGRVAPLVGDDHVMVRDRVVRGLCVVVRRFGVFGGVVVLEVMLSVTIVGIGPLHLQ